MHQHVWQTLYFFATGEDDTDLALGKCYLTDKNLLWAINLPESYVHFGRWAQSHDLSFMD
jgi:hypothetical protein